MTKLLARARHRAGPDQSLGREEIAMLPAHLGAKTLAGAKADFAGDRTRRGRGHSDRDIDGLAVAAVNRLDRHLRH